MTWFKVDDRLHGHRKARIAGPAAMGLWVLAGSWAGDQLTDGFVPRSQIFAWAENAVELADRLVVAELWEPTVHLGEEGWLFHDWDDFQPTKKDVLERREAEREKKRRQRGSCPPGTTPGTTPGTHRTARIPSPPGRTAPAPNATSPPATDDTSDS